MANPSQERQALAALVAQAEVDPDRRFDPHTLKKLHLVNFDECPSEKELSLRRTVSLGNLGHTVAVYTEGGPSITTKDGDVVHHSCSAAALLKQSEDSGINSFEFHLLKNPVKDVTIVESDQPPVAFSRTVI